MGTRMRSSSSWTRSAIESFKHEVLRNIGGSEVVWIIVLTGILLFVSLGSHARMVGSLTENYEAAVERFGPGVLPGIITKYYGTPFEMLGTWWTLGDYLGGEPGILVVLWGGLLADAAIFSLSAFFIVFAVTKLRNDRERRLYYSQK